MIGRRQGLRQPGASIMTLSHAEDSVIENKKTTVGASSGGLHCATTDVHREGTLEDYFPKQIPGH